MKYLEPSVVIIDDKKEEVSDLIKHYHQSGIGCKFFNADLNDGDDYPQKKMSDVILLYLDLFYGDRMEDLDVELPVGWVRDIIPPKSFYILVIWTRDTSQADKVINKLEEHNIKPYEVLIENKGKYVDSSSGMYNFNGLLNSIDEKLSEMPALEEIQIWKNNLKRTSNVILGGLLGNNREEFTNKLKAIIREHGGEIILTNSGEKAMRERDTLFEALNNVLISNAPQYNSETEISQANMNGLYNILGNETVPIDKQLNSWFHFILKSDLNNKIFPGIIAKNNSSFLRKLYSIQDDDKIGKLLPTQLEAGVVIEDIVINITRPCDYAQKKYGKNLKLLSGIAIKEPKRDKKNRVDWNGQTPPDCVKIFDHLYYDDTCVNLTLLFDLRYSFSLPEDIFLNKFENMRMFTKELLSEIQVSYSSYVSRLGYTKFL